MELPITLKNIIEKYKSIYNIEGSDDEILKKVIPLLENEDIIQIYNDLCAEDKRIHHTSNFRPTFEKYREDILEYIDDSYIKSEIIQREQRQSSKNDLRQRNYIFISELATTLDDNSDKLKIIKSFHKKIKQLEEERNLLNVQDSINNIELSIHIYKCIMHILEKMSIDLDLYRGYTPEQKYKLQEYIDLSLLKEKRKKLSKEEQQLYLKNLYCNQIMKHINDLKTQLQELKQKEENKELDEIR